MVKKDPVLLWLVSDKILLFNSMVTESSLHFLSFSLLLLPFFFLFMALVSSWLQFLRKFMEQRSWYQDLWHSRLLILSCNKNRLFISSLCFMSQPFFLFCWDFASHPWLPSCLNSLLWWTKYHIYKSFCLNSSIVSVDLTLRSYTWALRASRYLTSLMYKMWPYPRRRYLGTVEQSSILS